MIRFCQYLTVMLAASVVLLSSTGAAHAQSHTNTQGSIFWPKDPPVGIGTEHDGGALNALHIHYDASDTGTRAPIIRLSEGSTTSNPFFGILELTPIAHDTTFTSIANQRDLILHENTEGDLILTNWSADTVTGAIRFATTGDTNARPIPSPGHHDLERMTILGNGNVGIDLPPDTTSGLGKPLDQVQIGGGSIVLPGYTSPIPGLTIYGGNRFEGMPKAGGGTYPVDWRGIAFNHYENHTTGVGYRQAPISWSGIGFGDADGGLVDVSAYPWHTGDSLTDNTGNMTLQLQGNTGLYLWCDDRAIGGSQYHHLFEVWRKGYDGGLGIRNDSGLFLHHTPVYIGGTEDANFTNFHNVRPDIGDDSTWMLAVNGAALVKELFILDTVWADYVFEPGYKLMPTVDLERYIEGNHHLPGVPSAAQILQSGVPVGRTEAALTKNVEELTLRTIQLSKQNGELAKQNEALSKAIEELQTEVTELKKKAR